MKNTTSIRKKKRWHRDKLKLLALFVMLLIGQIGFAQFTFPPISGPTAVPGGTSGTVLNVNDAANTEGVSAGAYEGFIVTVDWSNTDNAYSSESRITVTTASGSSGEISSSNGATNGNDITLTFTGDFNGYYVPEDDGLLDIQLRQTWGSSEASWSNITIELVPAPTCIPPTNIIVEELSTNTVTITWEEVTEVPSEGFEWELLDESDDVIDFGVVLPTNDFEAEIAGLTAMTTYTLQVKSLCDAIDESDWATVTFTTLCDALDEWSENFDSYNTGSFLPDCWERVISGSGSLTISSTSPASGTRNIYMYSSSAANAVMAVLPPLTDVDAGTHWLKFKVRSSTANGTIKLGYVTADMSIDSFVELEDILTPNTSYATGEIQMFEIPTTVPSNARLAILNPGLNSYSYYLDDFEWEEIPSCIEVTGVSVNAITSTGAELSWISDGDLFDVEIVEEGDTPTEVPTDMGVGNPFTTVTPLEPNTTYEFYVRQDCGFGDVSQWSGPYTFTTLCEPESVLPYVESFDAHGTGSGIFPPCWQRPEVYGTTPFPSIVSLSTAPSSPGVLRFQSAIGTPTYAVSPAFVEDVNNLRVKFQLRKEGNSSGSMDFGVMSDAGDIDTFELIETINPGTDYAFNEYVYYLDDVPLTGGNYHIAFRYNAGASAAWYYYLDDFVVEEIPTCIEPSDLDANGITSTGAELSWLSDGTLFDIEIVEAGEDPTGTPTDTGVGNPFTTVTPLEPNTTYEFYVRQDCGFGDVSQWSGPYSFTTLCEAFDEWSENFDSYDTGSFLPSCWERVTSGSGGLTISSTSPASGNRNIYMYSSSASNVVMAVLPSFSDVNAGTHWLRFKARSTTANGTLKLGYVTDDLSIDEFIELEDILTPNTSYATGSEQFFEIPTTVPANARLAILNPGLNSYSFYLDDFIWEEIPTCFEVTNVVANGITATGVELSWVSDGDSFDVEIVEAGEDPTGTPTYVDVDNPFVITDDLNPLTTYDVYVRQDCGGGDLSNWTPTPVTFTTLCAVELAPTVVEDFSTFTGSITATSLPCWAEATANEIGDPLSGTTSVWNSGNYNNDASHINGTAAHINMYSTRNEWLISPVIDLGDGTIEYALRYDTSVVPWSGSSNVDDMGSDKYVSVVISTDGGASWSNTNVLTMYDNNNIPNNGGISEIISLDGYTGEVRIAFFAKSSSTATDLRFYIDNFRVEEMPSCLEPLTGSVDNIGTDSATINWSASDSPNASAYEYEIRTGEEDNEVVVASGTTTAPATSDDVTGLSGATEYKVYVRTECATDDFSIYNLVATFTTLCDAADVPYYVPLNDTTGSELPLCVDVVNVDGDSSTWTTSNGGNGIEGRVMFYPYTYSNDADDWFFLRGVNMEEGESYRLTFKYRAHSTAYDEKLRVSYGTAADPASMNEELFNETFNHTTGVEEIIDFVVDDTGVVYIGFQAHSDSGQYNIYVGEISVQKTPTCFPPLDIEVNNITKFAADVTWAAPNLGNDVNDGYEVEIRTEGVPGEGVGYVDTVLSSTLSASLANLDPDTSYLVFVKSLCTEVDDESLWSEPVQFRTLCDAPDLIEVINGEICGSGTTTLEAEYTSGIVQWFDSEEGGELLHTGDTFTTPHITEETSFWVQAMDEDTVIGNGGPEEPAGSSATTPSTWGLIFDAFEPFTLKSVDVFLASSSAGTLVVRLTDSDGTTMEEQSIPVPAGGSSSSPVQHTVQLDMDIPEGEGMRLLAVSGPSMIRDSSLGGYPYELGTVGQITNGYINGTSTTYYFFYNWAFEKGCYSERTEVVVEITDAPEFSLSAETVSVCGSTPSDVVTVVEGLDDYEVFEWTPSTGVSGDENTGWTFNPTTSTTYTLVASKLTEDCAQTVELEVQVGNYPTPMPLADEYSVCINEVQMLNVQVPVTGSNAHTVTWSPATDLYIDLAATVPYTGQNVNRVYFKSTTGVVDAEYNVSVTNNSGCTVEDSTIINVPIIPTPDLDVVYLCEISTVEDINDLYSVNATWYESMDSQTSLSSISESGTYYASNNVEGCSSERVEVDVTVVGVVTPTGESLQQFCDNATIEDLVVSHTTGSTLRVYETAVGGTTLSEGSALFTGTFYVSEQIADCESDRLAIEVTVTQTPPAIAPATITICGFAVMEDVEIGQQPNAELVWYANETTPQPMNGNSQVYSGTYYASQRVGICESERTAITFVVNDALPLPTASSQTFCGSAVVSDLVVTGVDGAMFRWFDSATSTDVLADDEPLSNGTYYVSQELDGCESNRKAISVQIVNTAEPQIANMSICEGTTIAEVEIPATTGVTYKWYMNPVAITALPESTTLSSGTYYISSVYNGCESERVVVDIETTPVPDAPTGETEQTFVYNESINEVTISNLVVNEEDVLWFAHEEDAATLTNPLQPDMPLSDGTTYYGVIVSDNGCVSNVLAVTVTVTLSNNKFDRAKLAYYPNPTQGILNIQYSHTIERVEIYNTIGQLVGKQDFNSSQITVDMSNLSNGTYLLKLHIDGYQQLIKVVKN